MNKKRPLILVIDDEEDLLDVLKHQFENQGFDVMTAENGLVGLDLLQKFQIEAIITDLNMPKCNGKDLLKKIRTLNPKDPPVFFCTCNVEIKKELISLGAQAVFEKISERKHLIKTVREWFFSRAERFNIDDFKKVVPLHKIDLDVDEDCHNSELINISEGGVCLSLDGNDKDMNIGKTVKLKVKLNGNEWGEIEGTGEVRWSKDKETVGIKFLNLSEESVEELSRILNVMRAARVTS